MHICCVRVDLILENILYLPAIVVFPGGKVHTLYTRMVMDQTGFLESLVKCVTETVIAHIAPNFRQRAVHSPKTGLFQPCHHCTAETHRHSFHYFDPIGT